MNKSRLFQKIFVLSLLVICLAACGNGDSEVGRRAEVVTPLPDASISATIDTGRKASSGTLSFKVSETGLSITNLKVNLKDANCDDMITMGSVTDLDPNPNLSIIDGAFEGTLPAMGGMVTNYNFNPPNPMPTQVADPYSVGKISGRFATPTSASGTITIFLGAPMSGGIVCELGTFDWSSE